MEPMQWILPLTVLPGIALIILSTSNLVISLNNEITQLKEELKKVSWTTKDELISSTKVVIISVFCFGIGIYLMDLAIKGILELVKRTLLFIFG